MLTRIGKCSNCDGWVVRNGSMRGTCEDCRATTDVPVIKMGPRFPIKPRPFSMETTIAGSGEIPSLTVTDWTS